MNERRTLWLVGAAIGVAIAVGIGVWRAFDGPGPGSAAGPREYGALATLPSASEAPVDPDRAGASPSAQATQERESGSRDSLSGDEREAARLREAKENAVFGRPALAFDPSRLEKLGYDEEVIASVRERFSDYGQALQREADQGRPIAYYRLGPDEREERRQMRRRYLSDGEFEAGLIATAQRNRVELTRVRENSRVWSVGLRPGDELIYANGIRVFDLDDFKDGIGLREEGQLHEIVVLRRGKVFDAVVQCCEAGWSGLGMKLAPPFADEIPTAAR